MTRIERLHHALALLNQLIDQGYYFNPAIAQVCTQYGLDDLEYQAITDLYDAQG